MSTHGDNLTDEPRSRRRAFTLIEMMITVGLLGFIVLGLTAMFIQTQRAFRAGTQCIDDGNAPGAAGEQEEEHWGRINLATRKGHVRQQGKTIMRTKTGSGVKV